MKSRKRHACLIATLLPALLLTGCWDRREINDVAFVLANSFDIDKNGQYKQAVIIALPGQMGGSTGGGGGTSGKSPYYIDDSVGFPITNGANKLQVRMSRVLNYAHRRVIIIGEELARKGIRVIFDVLARIPQNRITTYFVIGKESGEKLLKAKPHLERFSGEAIREILTLNPSGKVNLNEIWQKLSNQGIDMSLPVFKSVKNKGPSPSDETMLIGTALFSSDKMVGMVTGSEASAIRWLTNKFQRYRDVIPFGDKSKDKVGIQIESGDKRLELISMKEPLRFRLSLHAEGSIVESTVNVNLDNEQYIKEMEKMWAKHMKAEMEKLIAKMQNLHSDVMGAGYLVYQTHPKEWDKVKNRWYDVFKKAKFDIHANLLIRRVGQVTENVDIWTNQPSTPKQ
ncbi:UNVERIFIED_CONTAM: Ger(x)C family germination protein [Brevibacillus sp. OAP136]